jgi:hypothetical protein
VGKEEDTLGHFAEGWRIRRESTGNRLKFILSNVMMNRGVRGQAKFMSVELGNRAQKLKPARRTYRFLGQEGWVTIKEGTRINRPARRGAHVMASSRAFILRTILPQVSIRVDQRVRALLDSTE